MESFTLLTCPAGEALAAVHARQPVVVAPEGYGAWLAAETPASRVQAPHAGPFEVRRVGALVNDPRSNVTVNAIAPGYIDTDMVRAVPEKVLEKIIATIPVGRLGHASEIAKGVLFLVDDDMGFMTGSTLSINGGQHMY